MAMRGDITTAILRAEVKKRVVTEVARLPAGEQRGVILEVLAEVDPSALRALGTGSQTLAGATSARSGGITAAVLKSLKEQPGRPIAELAVAAYGDDSTDSKAKTRSILVSLNKQKRIRRMGKTRGRWRVVE